MNIHNETTHAQAHHDNIADRAAHVHYYKSLVTKNESCSNKAISKSSTHLIKSKRQYRIPMHQSRSNRYENVWKMKLGHLVISFFTKGHLVIRTTQTYGPKNHLGWVMDIGLSLVCLSLRS